MSLPFGEYSQEPHLSTSLRVFVATWVSLGQPWLQRRVGNVIFFIKHIAAPNEMRKKGKMDREWVEHKGTSYIVEFWG